MITRDCPIPKVFKPMSRFSIIFKLMDKMAKEKSVAYFYDDIEEVMEAYRFDDNGTLVCQGKAPQKEACGVSEDRWHPLQDAPNSTHDTLFYRGILVTEYEFEHFSYPYKVDMIDRALKFATMAHEGQLDKDGLPYILHPITVGLRYGKTQNQKIVGLLHDVVEDTPYTFNDIRFQGFSENIIEALMLLTHQKEVSYDDYLKRIKESGNKLAISVKINDLTHNLQRGKAGGHEKQVKKHTAALKYMQS